MKSHSVGQDRQILTCLPSVLALFAIRRSQTTEVKIRLFLPYLRSGDRASPSVGGDRLILTCLSQTTDVGQLHRLGALEEKLDKCFYAWYNLRQDEISVIAT